MTSQARVVVAVAAAIMIVGAGCGGKVRPPLTYAPSVGGGAAKPASHELVVLLFEDEEGFCTLAPSSSFLRVRGGDTINYSVKKIGSFNGCSEDDFRITDFFNLETGSTESPLEEIAAGRKRKSFRVKSGFAGRKFKYAIRTKQAIVDPELDIMM